MTLDQNLGYFLLLVGIAKALVRHYRKIEIHQTGYTLGVRSVRISEGAAHVQAERRDAPEDDQAAAPIISQLPVPAICNRE